MAKSEANSKPVLADEDVYIATMQVIWYSDCQQLNTYNLFIDIFHQEKNDLFAYIDVKTFQHCQLWEDILLAN